MELYSALEDLERILRLLQPARSSSVPPSGPNMVAASFARVEARGLSFSASFYARLFAARSDIRSMFPESMQEQQLKLVGTLQLAIEHLARPERLTPLLEELGRRHRRYGVRPADFELVGSCLLATLAEFDAEHWNAALEQAWSHAYQHVSLAMQRGLSESNA